MIDDVKSYFDKELSILIQESNQKKMKELAEIVIDLLDEGSIRVCEKSNGNWIVNDWIKKAILMYFRTQKTQLIEFSGPTYAGGFNWCDKIPLKFSKWSKNNFDEMNIRAVPGSIVRKSAYIGSDVVLMPSFVNVGAYVGVGTMVDTWASVGSCAQIGKNCHISGGAGIGGVLEPLSARPVIVENNCFIGARSEIVDGVIIREGSVIAMGVFIGSSTRIVNRSTGEVSYGEVPPYSVVVPGSYLCNESKVSLYCAVIVKTVDDSTRCKVSINDILRSASN
ncbi:2,3,4,5-tetrahydropyridine-2,6-dicarboxylate N-succinyltransferase [Neoehrlichia mikurensis]|uniref:2,3,4,5-tetrahydropyridine-2,6-dicarboxylate N-succinyltransferase n=1 Tax=Neoehrlichia mikurensis TaxID=89586 RepID=A0A9Q9C1U6_9RICK|nr:2,3,4,5-tetrahydropyridine-2,6-dicarboxylate N-succinyltransferase [Neoehrlichia mikurensis]QXK92298.1 2,3,4,5-tetrahydropyridine-2,6-dicarboxylate N-succinyltransferase [Neoehrlichia mikurensis]QXK92752.1 2,3,4,5-tetrahydropyridine-2,6-dicarboxylate N-succinyltransferase [Neoehrlichia mikurensis]QXK93993.1 2,3,4,5-tetrahydropyridine-2,6-dicarboxylate N-succinyltransferase [Neoehrlichia mikurensis]UTO55844.1 2,3,4,5-tetrahydropyridine-2,6-dicarboxylate N-succinyltransferase [Neoehrlichia mik